MTRGLIHALLMAAFVLPAQVQSNDATEGKVRILVLYREDLALNFAAGVQDALRVSPIRDRLTIEERPYVNEQEATEKLVSVIRNHQADIVLGPTDSGVYLDTLSRTKECRECQVPVISPTVSAPLPRNHPKGWFFRTNIDARRRIEAVADYLHRFWISSVAILCPDTAFGRLAERHFYENINGRIKQSYQQLKYTEQHQEKRAAVRRLLNTRPEAVGLFGPTEDILALRALIDDMSGLQPYHPILFTIVDTSLQAERLSKHRICLRIQPIGRRLGTEASRPTYRRY